MLWASMLGRRKPKNRDNQFNGQKTTNSSHAHPAPPIGSWLWLQSLHHNWPKRSHRRDCHCSTRRTRHVGKLEQHIFGCTLGLWNGRQKYILVSYYSWIILQLSLTILPSCGTYRFRYRQSSLSIRRYGNRRVRCLKRPRDIVALPWGDRSGSFCGHTGGRWRAIFKPCHGNGAPETYEIDNEPLFIK